MHKNAWLGVLAACGVVLTGALAVRAQRAEQAQVLTERALRLLHPPLAQAPSLRDIRGREARELLEQAQALSEDDARASLIALAHATELYADARYAAAAQALEQQHSNSPQTLELMAAIELARGKPVEANQLLARTWPEDKNDARAALIRSDVARALGRGDVALSSVQPFFKKGQPSAALYERRGLAHALLGDRAQAKKDLARAAELDRQSTSALLALGRLQRDSGALSQAVLAFHEAAQRNPNDAEAWLGAGVCRAALGDNTSARVDLERAAAAAQTRAEPLIALADLDVKERDLANALRRYHAALLLDPHNALGRVKLGNTLLRAGEVPAAIPEFQAAIAQRPDLAAAYNGLGAALFAQGRFTDAATELKKATELDPKDPHPWLNLARVYKRQGNDDGLAAALEQARARDTTALAVRH